eukprot:3495355-Prymnesium_polylepis.1
MAPCARRGPRLLGRLAGWPFQLGWCVAGRGQALSAGRRNGGCDELPTAHGRRVRRAAELSAA